MSMQPRIECCGRKVTTRFCPHCGEPALSPLARLLIYCESHQQRCRTDLAGRKDPKHPGTINCQKRLAEWTSYVTALQEVLGADQTKEPAHE